MGNPNCYFVIIAVTFFFSSQSPRGTVIVVMTDRTFGLAKLFSQTSTVQSGPNDRTYFCRTQNFFSYFRFAWWTTYTWPYHWSLGKIAKKMPRERQLMTSHIFWPFLTYLRPTYLVLLYNVPFLGLSCTPLPTLISDVINGRSPTEPKLE